MKRQGFKKVLGILALSLLFMSPAQPAKAQLFGGNQWCALINDLNVAGWYTPDLYQQVLQMFGCAAPAAPQQQANNNNYTPSTQGFDSTQSTLPIAVQGTQVASVDTNGLTVSQGTLTANNGVSIGATNKTCGWGQGAGLIQFVGGSFQACDGNKWNTMMGGTSTSYNTNSCWFFC